MRMISSLKTRLNGSLLVVLLIILGNALPAAGGQGQEVAVGLKLHQVTAINQKQENFSAVVTMIMRWRDPDVSAELAPGEERKMFEANSFLRLMEKSGLRWPAVSFYNAQGRIDYQNRMVVVDNQGTITYLARFTATFQAPDFDFKHFPFDHQKFYILLDSFRPIDQVIFTELEGYSQIGDALGEEEWIIGEPTVEITTHKEVELVSSRFVFGFEGERHLNYYFVRIFLPVAIIILVSWFSFFLKDYTKRIDLASGNLLLFIAFSFTIANDLPRLGYLTLMDTFLLATFAITGLVVLSNVALKRLEREERMATIRRIDMIGVWGYPIFYACAGLLMLIVLYYT